MDTRILTMDTRFFHIFRMAGFMMKILMSISSFTVEVSMKGISFFPNNDILKIYFFVRLLISSSSSPWVHSKNISSIYLSRKEGLICSMFKNYILYFVHKYATLRRRNVCSNDCTWYLFLISRIKFKIVVF